MKPVLPRGVERVYHYHVRKTAGTSLNSAFWSLGGVDLAAMVRTGWRLETGGIVFVRHRVAEIERGDWFFANSHVPAHRLRLPVGTFTVTVLRDPLQRLVSYYQYLHYLDATNKGDGTTRDERESARGRFGNFVSNLPKEHRERQLFMFSRSFSVDEAVERATRVDAVLFTEQFADGIARLGQHLGLTLPVRTERRFPHLAEIGPDELAAASEALQAELVFVDAMRAQRSLDGA